MSEKCFQRKSGGEVFTFDGVLERFGDAQGRLMMASGFMVKAPCVLAKDPETLTEDEQALAFILSPVKIPRVRDIGIEELVLILAVVKLSKMPDGLKTLQAIATKYLDTVAKTLVALEAGASSNWLTAIVNQKLSLRVLRNLGLLTPGEALNLEQDYNYIFHITIAKEGIVEGLAAAGTLAKGIGAIIPG